MRLYGKVKAFPFPFTGALWALWLLALAPTIWTSVFPCTANPEYFYSGYPALIVLVCAWEAHVRWLKIGIPVHTAMIFPIVGRAIANLLILIFFSLVITIPATLFLPAYQCYTDRTKVSELVLATISLRDEIEERVKASGTLEKAGLNISVRVEGRVSAGFVSDTGTIILISENPPAVVAMTPKLVTSENRTLQWKCMGYPQKISPMSCRDEQSK